MPEGEKPEAGEEGQEPNSQDQTQQDPQPANTESWDDLDVEKAKKTLAKLREAERDAKALKRERDDLEAKVKEFERSQLSETEKLVAENADMKAKVELLERTARETHEREQITSEARSLGFIDEDDAVRLVDRSLLQVEEATGRITNLQSVLNALLKAKPHLHHEDGQPEAQQRSTITPTPSRQATPNLNEVAESNRALLQSSGRYAS